MRMPSMLAYGATLLLAVSCLSLWLVASALQWPWWAQMMPFLAGLAAAISLFYGTAATNPRHDSPSYRGLT
jgi:hypothetical protein